LAALIESYCGLKPSKKEQRSNWGARPLTDSQVAYARLDTHFLPDLHQRLRGEVIEKGMLDHAEHEFERQQNDVLSPREPNMEGWLKFKGVKKFAPEAAARVRALFQWRELRAMEIDKPVFRVLPNDTILDLGEKPPQDMRDLAGRRGVGWRVAKKVGDEMMAALEAVRGESIETHISKPLSPEERRQRRTARENQDALRTWRKQMAQKLELPSERLMHRRQLEKIAHDLPRTSDDLQRTLPMNDWQRENLEPSLLALLEKLPDPQNA
jgi:ribonuclease D